MENVFPEGINKIHERTPTILWPIAFDYRDTIRGCTKPEAI